LDAWFRKGFAYEQKLKMKKSKKSDILFKKSDVKNFQFNIC